MNKNILLLLGSLIFSLLFFKQDVGLNFLLFSLTTVTLLCLFNAKRFKNKKVLLAGFLYLIMALFVFIYNSTLSIFTAVIAFFYLLGIISEHKSSVYIQLLNGFFSSIASGFTLYYERFSLETKAVKKNTINYIYWLKMVGIPIIVLLIFVILYRSANPYFNEIINKIDFSFINLQWVLFTIMGYFLLLNISNPIVIENVTEFDLKTDNNLNKDELKPQSIENIKQEKSIGYIITCALKYTPIVFLDNRYRLFVTIVRFKRTRIVKNCSRRYLCINYINCVCHSNHTLFF